MHDFAVYDILADGDQVFEGLKVNYGILRENDAAADKVFNSIVGVGRIWDHISIYLRSELDKAEEDCMISCVRSCRGDIRALSASLESMGQELSGHSLRPPLRRDHARILSALERLQPAVKILDLDNAFSSSVGQKRQATNVHTSWGRTLFKLIVVAGALAAFMHCSAAKDDTQGQSTAAAEISAEGIRVPE